MAPGLARMGGGVSFAGVGNMGFNTATTVPIQQSAQTKIGDLVLFLAGSVGANTTWAPPGSMTEIFDPGAGADAEAGYIIASSAGAQNLGNATTGTSNNKSSAAATFRKAAYDAIGASATLGTTGSLVLPSVTLSKGGMLVALVFSNTSTATHAAPGSMLTAGQSIGGGYPLCSIFYERIGAGASGTRTITIGGTPGNSIGALVGLIRA